MEGLEDEADLAAAKAREPVLVEAGIVLAGDDDAAGVDPLQPGNHHQQRRFAGARRPDQADAFAAADGEVDAAQHMHARRAAAERQVDIVEEDDGFTHAAARLYHSRRFGIWVEDEEVQNARLLPRRRARCRAWRPAALPASAEPVEIVALGDSLTAGYGLGPGESFPEQLEAALKARGHDVTVANAGVSGDTASDGLARLEWSVPAEADIVIVELGANDALRGIDPAVTRKALSEILAKLTGARPGGAARRHAGAAQSRRRLRGGVRRDLSGPRGAIRRAALSVLPRRAWRRMRRSISRTACIRTRRASRRSSRRCFRRSKRSIAKAAAGD